MMQPGPLQRLRRKLDKTLASVFFIDQWVILTGRDMDYTSLRWEAFRPLVPDKDRYWADPFVIQRDGRYFVFVEEKLYRTRRGRIACLELDAEGSLVSRRIALECEFHLSYPFVFEYGHEMFMLPEAAESGRLELYRCVHFPDKWEPFRVLLENTYVVDATLLEHGGKSWLFANVKEAGASSLNALYLFWADNPLAGTWRSHPRNPIVRDLASARPAGRIFLHGGQLIRPAQDSMRRYGFSLKFNRITRLDEEGFGEEPVGAFLPRGGRIRATHTFNQAGDLTVIDAVIRRAR